MTKPLMPAKQIGNRSKNAGSYLEGEIIHRFKRERGTRSDCDIEWNMRGRMGLRNKGDSGSLSVANNLHKINTSDWRRGSANHIH